MSYEFLDDLAEIPDYRFRCPRCNEKCVFIHDLRCQTCNDRDIVWCPRCEKHIKVKFN